MTITKPLSKSRTGHPVFEIDQEKVLKGALLHIEDGKACLVTGFEGDRGIIPVELTSLQKRDLEAEDPIILHSALLVVSNLSQFKLVATTAHDKNSLYCMIVYHNTDDHTALIMVRQNEITRLHNRKYLFDGQTIKEVKT